MKSLLCITSINNKCYMRSNYKHTEVYKEGAMGIRLPKHNLQRDKLLVSVKSMVAV